jgi:Xaa-Pro aminopeptidase
VVTIEPGLYYPQKGLGVRLEDTVWAFLHPQVAGQPVGERSSAGFEILAPYPLDLVLPVKAS